MMLITCPWCGARPQTEFAYVEDALRARPADDGAGSEDAWFDLVYLRDDPKGPSREYWQHILGCRAILVVSRDTLTHAISAAAGAGAGAAR